MRSMDLLSELKSKLGELPLRRHATPVHVRDGAAIEANRAEALVWQTVGGVREEPATTAGELMIAMDCANGASTVAVMTGTGFAGPAGFLLRRDPRSPPDRRRRRQWALTC